MQSRGVLEKERGGLGRRGGDRCVFPEARRAVTRQYGCNCLDRVNRSKYRVRIIIIVEMYVCHCETVTSAHCLVSSASFVVFFFGDFFLVALSFEVSDFYILLSSPPRSCCQR